MLSDTGALTVSGGLCPRFTPLADLSMSTAHAFSSTAFCGVGGTRYAVVSLRTGRVTASGDAGTVLLSACPDGDTFLCGTATGSLISLGDPSQKQAVHKTGRIAPIVSVACSRSHALAVYGDGKVGVFHRDRAGELCRTGLHALCGASEHVSSSVVETAKGPILCCVCGGALYAVADGALRRLGGASSVSGAYCSVIDGDSVSLYKLV